MKISVATLVIVNVHMFDARPVVRDDLRRGVADHLKVAVANIQMKSQFRNRIEHLAELCARIKFAGDVLNHQANPAIAGRRQKFTNAFKILLDYKMTRMKWRVTIRMEVHPFRTDL